MPLFYIIKLFSSFLIQLTSLSLIYLLEPAQYGSFILILSLAQLMFLLTSGWSNGALINLGSRNFLKSGSYIDIVFYRTVIILMSLLVISLSYLTSIDIITYLSDNEKYLVYILFIGLIFYDYASQLLYPGNKVLLQSSLELIISLFLIISMVVFVRNTHIYIYTYATLSFIFLLASLILFLLFFKADKLIINITEFKFVFKYSAWQLLGIISIYITNMGINYIFVLCDVSKDSIGIYNFSYRMFMGFSPFFALFGITIPKLIHSQKIGSSTIEIHKKILYYIIILSCIYLCIGFLLEPMILFLQKKDYVDSSKYFIYLFPAFIFMSYCNLMNTVIANTSHFKQALVAITIQGIILLLTSYPLILIYNVNGAIISTTLSFLFGAIYFYKLSLNITTYSQKIS